MQSQIKQPQNTPRPFISHLLQIFTSSRPHVATPQNKTKSKFKKK